MAQHGYPPALVEKVERIIDAANVGDMPPNTAYEDICELLFERGILKEKVLTVEEVMCHMTNRGTLGLNGHNVHKNGHEVDTVGCDLKELNKAACFEVCPLEPKRSEQFGWNQRLIDLNHGLLAPLFGKEHAMSVGTGHWTAWCRAILANCKTPYKKMAGEGGRLLPDRFKRKDKRMKVVLEVGFTWRYFPWQTEVAWPRLPDLCQRALNSSHSVTSRSNELEVMSAIADLDADRADSQPFQSVLDTVALSAPPCVSYLNAVGELARQCGGGQGAPLVKFLDRLGKKFGASKMLGEEFVSAVVEYKTISTEGLVYLKVACCACNITAKKVVDGVARLLVKSDLDKMKSPKGKGAASEINNVIEKAWIIGEALLETGVITPDAFDMVLGKFMVRAILLWTDKQQHGAETTVYKDTQDIKLAFVKSMRCEADDENVDLKEWTTIVTDEEAPKQSKKRDLGMMAPHEVADPICILASNGFEVDVYVKEKGIDAGDGSGDGFYQIKSIDKEFVHLSIYNMFEKNDDTTVKVKVLSMLDKWSIFNSNVPSILQVTPMSPMRFLSVDVLRQKAFEALMGHEAEAGDRMLKYTAHPYGLLAASAIAKGSLKLAPLTQLINLNPKHSEQSSPIDVDRFRVNASAMKRGKKEEDAKDDKCSFVPYWWVESTTNEKLVNMRRASMKRGNVTFEVLQNTKAISKHQRLYLQKPIVAKKAPLKDAIITKTETEDGASDPPKAPAKRARR